VGASPLDPRRHARYLAYREAYGYFRVPGQAALEQDEWARLDDELAALLSATARLTAAQRRRVRELRAALLRD
jgi:hypothetical protein